MIHKLVPTETSVLFIIFIIPLVKYYQYQMTVESHATESRVVAMKQTSTGWTEAILTGCNTALHSPEFDSSRHIHLACNTTTSGGSV